MKTACPACGSAFSLDALIGNEGAREAVMTALAIPAPLGKLLVQYLGLFRPAQRQLSFDRVASLLGELLPMIADAKIERGGRIWSAPHDYWAMALTEMIAKRDNLTLPLKSHGYLLAIIEGYGLKAEGKAEANTEAQRGHRTAVGGKAMLTVDQVLGKQDDKPRGQMPASVKAAIKPTQPKGGNDANS